MKRKQQLVLSWVFFCCLVSPRVVAAADPLRHPFLEWLGRETRVVVSAHAHATELNAAKDICRYAGVDPALSLVTDSSIVANKATAGSNHLIVVGNITDNAVFVRYPSTWVRAREHQGGVCSVRGLFFFGIGDTKAPAVGVLEPGRNPYNVLLEDEAAHHGSPFTAWRWMLRLTGRTPRGVVRAVQAFLNDHMLSGVVGMEQKPVGATPFVVSRSLATAKPPAGMGTVAGTTHRFIGWHQIDAFLINGFASKTGFKPEFGWRFAYRENDQSTAKNASPHRRNTDGEILLLSMPTDKSAQSAAHDLLDQLGEAESIVRENVKLSFAHHEDDIVHAGVVDHYLGLESIPHPDGRIILLSLLHALR